jgi:hypothetical protein
MLLIVTGVIVCVFFLGLFLLMRGIQQQNLISFLRCRDQQERARNEEFREMIQGWIRGKLNSIDDFTCINYYFVFVFCLMILLVFMLTNMAANIYLDVITDIADLQQRRLEPAERGMASMMNGKEGRGRLV